MWDLIPFYTLQIWLPQLFTLSKALCLISPNGAPTIKVAAAISAPLRMIGHDSLLRRQETNRSMSGLNRNNHKGHKRAAQRTQTSPMTQLPGGALTAAFPHCITTHRNLIVWVFRRYRAGSFGKAQNSTNTEPRQMGIGVHQTCRV